MSARSTMNAPWRLLNLLSVLSGLAQRDPASCVFRFAIRMPLRDMVLKVLKLLAIFARVTPPECTIPGVLPLIAARVKPVDIFNS